MWLESSISLLPSNISSNIWEIHPNLKNWRRLLANSFIESKVFATGYSQYQTWGKKLANIRLELKPCLHWSILPYTEAYSIPNNDLDRNSLMPVLLASWTRLSARFHCKLPPTVDSDALGFQQTLVSWPKALFQYKCITIKSRGKLVFKYAAGTCRRRCCWVKHWFLLVLWEKLSACLICLPTRLPNQTFLSTLFDGEAPEFEQINSHSQRSKCLIFVHSRVPHHQGKWERRLMWNPGTIGGRPVRLWPRPSPLFPK